LKGDFVYCYETQIISNFSVACYQLAECPKIDEGCMTLLHRPQLMSLQRPDPLARFRENVPARKTEKGEIYGKGKGKKREGGRDIFTWL